MTLVALLVAAWSALYVVSATWHAKQALFPRQDIGFGPHVMPWPEALLMGAKGLFGLLLAALLLAPSIHRLRWLALLAASLLAINIYNLHAILQWMPEAEYSKVSVLVFFSPVLLVEYAVEALALLVGAALFTAELGRSRAISR